MHILIYGGEMVNGTLIRASDERKLLWSALDVAGSRFGVNMLINYPLLGEGVLGPTYTPSKLCIAYRGL